MEGKKEVVYLFKSPKEPDPYKEEFLKSGYEVCFIPVLQFELVNTIVLLETLHQHKDFGGLIFTSQRAVQALENAIKELNPLILEEWKKKPIFAFGKETTSLISEKLNISLTTIRGRDSHSAAALAKVVIEYLQGLMTNETPLPLLFLCGNRRRDELPKELAANGFVFKELVVYESKVKELERVEREDIVPSWVVFFSPSGVEALCETETTFLNTVKKAAIGPTTASAMLQLLGTVEAIATQPSPQALVAAIKASSN